MAASPSASPSRWRPTRPAADGRALRRRRPDRARSPPSELSTSRRAGTTILLVTHDPVEALELATQIVVLSYGAIVASGTPVDLTAPDSDTFVRDLFGGEVLALRRLRFTPGFRPSDEMPPCPQASVAIAPDASLWEALTRMISNRASCLAVSDGNGTVGSLDIEAVVERYR